MPHNYRIRIDQEEPSREEIHSHMDFDALLATHASQQEARRPLRIRRLVYLTSAAAAAILLLFMWQPLNRLLQAPSAGDYFASQPYVNPPSLSLAPTVASPKAVDAYKGGIIEYPSGSRIVVPAAAFMNDRGRLIGGDVEVHYRELHDYVDFFVSGVPMAYDSAGLQRYLTSAGMVEVYAEQNGQRVQLAPGKTIQVELVSEVKLKDYFSLPTYYVYQMDTVERRWVYRNIDMVQFVDDDEQWLSSEEHSAQGLLQERTQALELEYREALAALQATVPVPPAPIKPSQASGERPTFELDFAAGELPLDPGSEVSDEDIQRLHEGTIWEILPESPEVDPRAFQVNWERVRLRQLQEDRYEIMFIHPDNQETLIARPVLLGEDYAQAMEAYDYEKTVYDAAVQAREEQLSERVEFLQQTYADRRAALQEQIQAEIDQNPEWLRRKIISRFVVNEFGYWNCAQPTPIPSQEMTVSYRDGEGNALENRTAFVINKEYNTLYRFHAVDDGQLTLIPGSENLVWVVDETGHIALAKLSAEEETSTIVLERIDETIDSEQTLRNLLQL